MSQKQITVRLALNAVHDKTNTFAVRFVSKTPDDDALFGSEYDPTSGDTYCTVVKVIDPEQLCPECDIKCEFRCKYFKI